ncbi:MAG: hypothetical protein HYR80_08675 [Nitrospirae bacterium]|nr:hypothetical protein [Nitrospirota bacterium]
MKRKTFACRSSILVLFLVLMFVDSLPSKAFEFKGFSDVKYRETNLENCPCGFGLGAVDLYLSEQLNDRMDFLAEIAFEFDHGGDGYGLDVERLQVGYAFNDNIKVRVGRFHNILGYWNTAFHHGVQLQTSIYRPQLVAFEDGGGLLPIHIVGIWFDGKYRTPVGKINYGLMVGNWPKIFNTQLQPNAGGDNSSNKSVSANITLHPSQLEGLALGVSGDVLTINDFAPIANTPGPFAGGSLTPTTEIAQTIYGAHVVYFGDKIELLSEYYYITNTDKLTQPNPVYSSHGYFIHAGYRLLKDIMPYVRYEELGVDDNDPFYQAINNPEFLTVDFSQQTSTVSYMGGIRYDLTQNSSLKGEYQTRNIAGMEAVKSYTLQWAFSF